MEGLCFGMKLVRVYNTIGPGPLVKIPFILKSLDK
jgi:hypothetical protein